MAHSFPFVILHFVAFATGALVPRRIEWSGKSYGPDGPWQAVTVTLGTSLIDLYPGGFWDSNILEASICNSTGEQPVCYAQAAGLYDSSASSTSVSQIETGSTIQNSSLYQTGNAIPQWGTMRYNFDTLSIATTQTQNFHTLEVPSFVMFLLFEAYSFLPDGSIYPMQVGNLALGAPDGNQTWARSGGGPNINGTLLPSYLYYGGQVESNSWGMHIGSSLLGIPGSLYIGGYDQSRVLGPVSVQEYGIDNLPIDLLDIGIGVAEGQSPFNFTSKSGLLAQGNSSIVAKLAVDVDATVPYLYLPQSTCNAITENLPVTYQSKYGLYFWDTSSPLYQKIVSSPAYLSFTFRMNASVTQNFTINVPFSLLNLTLTAPLINTPTQYFPCNPASHPPLADSNQFALGKAFLQAAFIGVNWQNNSAGRWFLAQAPGPNTPSTAVETAIGQTDNFVIASQNTWVETWKGGWTIIGTTTGNSTSTSPGTVTSPTSTSASTQAGTSGISSAATIGIGVGVGIMAVILLLLAFFYLRKRTAKRTGKPETILNFSSSQGFFDSKRNGGYAPREMDGGQTMNAVEMEGREAMDPVEMDGGGRRGLFGRYSRTRGGAGSSTRPAEMEG